MKFYLAARYTRCEELQGYAKQLIEMGHQVTSRWIEGNHQISDDGLDAEAPEEQRQQFALEDYHDLLAADGLIAFTEPPRSTASRGGRHVEYGMAIGHGKHCYVVEHRENIFHCLPQIRFFPTWQAFIAHIRAGGA